MTMRATLVGFLLAGLAILALSSLAPTANRNGPDRVACNVHGVCGHVPREFPPSGALTYYSAREHRGERFTASASVSDYREHRRDYPTVVAFCSLRPPIC
jgi:hypothetical protein